MPITELLERNARLYGQEICLTEINMDLQEKHNVTWLDYELIENNPAGEYRLQMTWKVFDEKANRLANLLIKRGIKKGEKVAILLMNCLEWLPVYFGILKAGAVAVPLNFRYTAEEIKYCLDLSDTVALIFGPEFIGRIETIYHDIPKVRMLFYAGENRPTFAESYDRLTANCSSEAPPVQLSDSDDAAIYFSSRNNGLSQGNSAQPWQSACCLLYRTEAPRANQKRQLFVHTAAVSYRRQDALVWQPAGRKQSGFAAGCQTEWILKTVSRGKDYHCLAFGSLGAGYP